MENREKHRLFQAPRLTQGRKTEREAALQRDLLLRGRGRPGGSEEGGYGGKGGGRFVSGAAWYEGICKKKDRKDGKER